MTVQLHNLTTCTAAVTMLLVDPLQRRSLSARTWEPNYLRGPRGPLAWLSLFLVLASRSAFRLARLSALRCRERLRSPKFAGLVSCAGVGAG
jgi:hypothetical protein